MTDWDCSRTRRHSCVVSDRGSHSRRVVLAHSPAVDTASNPSCGRWTDVAWDKDKTNDDSNLQSPANNGDCDAHRHTDKLTFVHQVTDVSGRRALRSAGTNHILVPPDTSTTVGSRAFSVAAPLIWNSLPDDVISA